MIYSNNNLSQLNPEGKFKYPVDKKTKVWLVSHETRQSAGD